jgi:tetratricopeptide (TPR) repeat protein
MASDDPDTLRSRLADRQARVQEALRIGDASSLRSALDLGQYAWELSRLRRWDEAEAAARRIEDDPEERGEALALLAQGLCEGGAFERAIAIVDQIPDDAGIPNAVAEKAIALVAIGKAVAAAGDYAEADKFFERAFASIEALGDARSPWSEPETFLEWGRAYLSCDRERALGLWRRAAHRAEELSGDIDCLKLLGEIGTEFARAGAIEEAEAIMSRHPLAIIRERLQAEIQRQQSDGDGDGSVLPPASL